MLLVDIFVEIQISCVYIERKPPKDMQFESRGYDTYVKDNWSEEVTIENNNRMIAVW